MSDLEAVTRLKHIPLAICASIKTAYKQEGDDDSGQAADSASYDYMALGEFGTAPLGGLVHRIDALGGVSSPSIDTDYWDVCDGGTISGGAFSGQATPTISDKFLKAVTGSTGGNSSGNSSHRHSFYFSLEEWDGVCAPYGQHTNQVWSIDDLGPEFTNYSSANLPDYYNVETLVRK